MRVALALTLLALLPATASADSAASRYRGRTTQDLSLAFTLKPRANREVQRFAIRYVSICSDGERLRSTFHFAPVALRSAAFIRSGKVSGALTDGRAYTAKVRLTGAVPRLGRSIGTFSLATRIPDAAGGVARCSTGTIGWKATRAG